VPLSPCSSTVAFVFATLFSASMTGRMTGDRETKLASPDAPGSIGRFSATMLARRARADATSPRIAAGLATGFWR